GVGEVCAADTDCQTFMMCQKTSPEAPEGVCFDLSQAFTEAAGEPCDLQAGRFCQQGLSCVFMGQSFSCQPPVAANAACSIGFPDQCPEGQFCNMDQTTFESACQATPAMGEPCVQSLLGPICGLGARCVNGVCAAPLQLGEACTANEACYAYLCHDGACAPNLGCQP
ncbi:hypothetical protein KKB55_09580, partial [Myxococcota bacterium]|nr:hypothetical protein [Myxococcota bacterium]